jgi:poly-gamma-glutamate synthesis protein (capsule biosynthesis protein)
MTISLALVILTGCQTDSRPASTVTLALLGDVMLGRDVHPTAQTFATLEPFLQTADLALANLESPLTNAPAQTKSSYVLCASPENVKYLVEAGFDLFSLANNHRLDCGEAGLEETQSTLTKAGLGFIGPDPNPIYRELNGIRLAFLAFDATSGFQIETATQAVRSAKETGAVVIVSIHWGAEYQSGASSNQKQIADELSKAGAALIWGHHPHVLQPAEWINAHKTLVLYSLGNAVFDQHGLESTRQSALVQVTLNASGVEKINAIPFLIDVSNSRIVEADPVSTETILGFFKRVTEKSDR